MVAGEHDHPAHTGIFQLGNGLGCTGLDAVGNEDLSGIDAVHGDVYHRSGLVAFQEGNAQLVHQLIVAGSHRAAVHFGNHTGAAALLHLGHTGAVQLLAIGLLQALADGVGRGALGQGSQFQQLRLLKAASRGNAGHFKDTFGEGTGLIKDQGTGLGQGFQVVGALDQHTLVAGTADAGKEGERNADDQRTRAADDQEGEGTVEPVPPSRGSDP